MSKSKDQQRAAGGRPAPDAATASVLWPPVTQLPTDGNVYLIFHGLFLFAHRRSDGACEVGVHNDAPDHDFQIKAWEVDADGGTTQLPVGNIPNAPITLDISSPQISGTHFFQPPEVAGEFDRRDWRLVPDLEGPNFYNVELRKVPGTLRPIIKINHGVFYTEMPTDFEFVRVSAGNVGNIVDLRRVAFYVGADVSHGQGGQVTLKSAAGGQVIVGPLMATGGKRYVIHFSNACPPGKPQCDFDPTSPIKEERNDFHLYFRGLRVPHGEHEFLMIKKSGSPAPSPESPTPPIRSFLDMKELEKASWTSTHEAPCGATSYGRTGGGFGDG